MYDKIIDKNPVNLSNNSDFNNYDFIKDTLGHGYENDFINTINLQNSSKLQQDLKLKLEKLVSVDESKRELVKEILEALANENNDKKILIYKSFLADMAENPELYEGVTSLRSLVDKIRERKDVTSDTKYFAEILNDIVSKTNNSDGEVAKMVRDLSLDNGALIHKIINAKDNKERIQALDGLIKSIQGLEDNKNEKPLFINNKNTLLKSNILNHGLQIDAENSNVPLYQSNGNNDYLMQNIASGKISMGFIFSLMLALNTLCMQIHGMKLMDARDPEQLDSDTGTFKRFLSGLLEDMGKDDECNGDLYKYLHKVMNGHDEALKRKYQDFLNKFGAKEVDFKETQSEDEENAQAKKLAEALNGYVQNMNDRLRTICQGKGFSLDEFHIDDENKRIVFAMTDSKDGKSKVIDPSWFVSSTKNLDDIHDDLAAMDTKLKGLIDASSKTMEATNSLIFNLIGALGQMYRGQ